MMMNILKTVFAFFLVSIMTSSLNAYKASEHIELNFDTTSGWVNQYTIPTGKDLIIYRLFANVAGSELEFRDNGGPTKAYGTFGVEMYDINLTFLDNLEVKGGGGGGGGGGGFQGAKNFTLFGYLVSEDEDIENYLQGDSNAWNKHIFDKEDIDFIYFREFIIFFFLVIIKFFSKIMGRRVNIF